MSFENTLAERKQELVEAWADMILGSYPKETQKVWRKQHDRFQNPVGAAIHEAAQMLFDHLLEWKNAEGMAEALDKLIRIRAVQNFTPSQALSFIFLLKKLLRDEFFKTMEQEGTLGELLRFEAKVDNLSMMAFDIYSKNREVVYRLRVEEVKRAQHNLLKRAKMIVDVTADKAGGIEAGPAESRKA
ncbi:RsbRD N-terminal domain-containing protein [Pseudodesulfovibrio tunisiensis]|uniref:RsbRD N-terminal domain-containing protein n=1 Tax=Pseudodesulfovibrio tunisiensis TaxID=463192 RepID=UPI001FB51716|nr:RsbRD N-terminal domain-containing protein [Pseudodesulfovibrio tunisiensis]